MNRRSRRVAEFLCVGAFLGTIVLVVASSHSAPTDKEAKCADCGHEKLRIIRTGDPAVDQANLAQVYAAAKEIQRKTTEAAMESRHAKMSKWHPLVIVPAPETKEADLPLFQSICRVFANEPPAQDARRTEFASYLDPNSDYRCIGYGAVVKSVSQNDEGWEVVLQVTPRLMSKRAAVVMTTHSCLETWQVLKDGSLQNLSCVATDPKNQFLLGD